MLRTLVERLSRERYFVRRLPLEFSRTPLYVSPDAQLKYLKPGVEGFDKTLLDIVSEYISKGDVVWDIGANVGVFAFAAASICGSEGYVLAVEPDIWLANLIQKSIRLNENKDLCLDVLPVAISTNCSVETFLVASHGRASNVLAKAGEHFQVKGYRERNLVPTFSLDKLLEVSEKPSFIKIDVEGAEIATLHGGKKVLSEIRPIIYCEVWEPYQEEVKKIFHSYNYKVFDSGLPGEKKFVQEKCAFNTLAYPAELLTEK